jgi:hypothetical protein
MGLPNTTAMGELIGAGLPQRPTSASGTIPAAAAAAGGRHVRARLGNTAVHTNTPCASRKPGNVSKMPRGGATCAHHGLGNKVAHTNAPSTAYLGCNATTLQGIHLILRMRAGACTAACKSSSNCTWQSAQTQSRGLHWDPESGNVRRCASIDAHLKQSTLWSLLTTPCFSAQTRTHQSYAT